jgi:hypothetical protein
MKGKHSGLAVVALSASALASAPAALSTMPPLSAYLWAQPGTAPVTTPFSQPSAWIPYEAGPSRPAVAMSDYRWQQPGTAPVTTPFSQPPASIP